MKYEIEDGICEKSEKEIIAIRVANKVIAGIYSCAREGAKLNVDKYTGHKTECPIDRNNEVGNFTRRIEKTLLKMGYDKLGRLLS